MPWKTIYVLCFHCTFYHRVNSSTSGNLKKKNNLWNWVFHIIRGKCDFHQFIYLIMEFAIGKLFPTNSKSVEFNFQRITGNSIPVEFGEFTQRPNSTGKMLSKNSLNPLLRCDFHECISRILFFHGICGKWFSTVIFQ